MARATFDSDSLNAAAKELMAASSSLSGLAAQLASIPHGSIADPVGGSLADLKQHGQQMIKQLDDDTNIIAVQLFKVARCYEDVENSILGAFQVADE